VPQPRSTRKSGAKTPLTDLLQQSDRFAFTFGLESDGAANALKGDSRMTGACRQGSGTSGATGCLSRC
jgi:hypothetical protein